PAGKKTLLMIVWSVCAEMAQALFSVLVFCKTPRFPACAPFCYANVTGRISIYQIIHEDVLAKWWKMV
ncbi:MAG: hypothetical protein IKB82_01730, partial [Clostridia bacterium]|nr:hypothetical protein [Clostridia bacterium]